MAWAVTAETAVCCGLPPKLFQVVFTRALTKYPDMRYQTGAHAQRHVLRCTGHLIDDADRDGVDAALEDDRNGAIAGAASCMCHFGQFPFRIRNSEAEGDGAFRAGDAKSQRDGAGARFAARDLTSDDRQFRMADRRVREEIGQHVVVELLGHRSA